MIVFKNVSHFVKICQVLTISHQLICRGVANFGTRCIFYRKLSTLFMSQYNKYISAPGGRGWNLFSGHSVAISL